MNKKCSDCGRVHAHQVVDYPMGAVVVVKNDFFGGFDMDKYDPLNMPADQAPRVIIPAGSLGHVVGHTDDGRALIEFEAENGHSNGSHSFHHPEGYFRLKETGQMRPALQIKIEFNNGQRPKTYQVENFVIGEGVLTLWDKDTNAEICYDMDDIDILSVITIEAKSDIVADIVSQW